MRRITDLISRPRSRCGYFETDGAKQNAASLTNPNGNIKWESLFPGPNAFYDDMVMAVHKLFTAGTILSSPVVVDDPVYLGNTDGSLYRQEH